MLWAIIRTASSTNAAGREKHHPAHAEYLRSHKKILVLSGPTLTDDGNSVIGSLLVVNVGSRAEAQAFADADPYQTAGMFTEVKIIRMRKGQWNAGAMESA